MFDLLSRPAAILAAALLFAAGVMPGTAQALGFGELSVESGPGEPLRLVIEVHSVSASEAETLDVSLAGRSDFAAAGVEYPSLADAMEFALVPLDQGGYQVVITTAEAVDDASLGLLVAATWAGGREVREYTASLAAAPSATSVSVGSVEEDDESTEDAAGEDARPVAIPGEEFVVESGHTLSHIVLWMNVPEDLHRFRAYLAVFRENPRAFINENMNLIRSGAVLRLPTFDEIRTVTYSESVAAYSEQLDQFTAYQQRVRQRRADPDPAPEPQIADTVTEPETAEPEVAPSAVTEEEPPVVEQPEAEVAAEPAPEAAEPAVEEVTEVTEEIAPEEPVQVDVTEPGQVTEPVETPPEIPEVEVAEEPAPAVEEPAGPQLTISQEADPEAVPAEDDDQALLKALESELAQMDETLLASGEETRNVQENLQQMQEQTGDISTLLEVENVPLATAQSRAAGEQEEDPGLPESVQADDGTTETPALESAEPQVSGVADDDGAVETVEVSEDQVAAPEEPAEVSAADAEPEAATGTDEILLAQQDTAPSEDEVPAVTGDAAVPAPAEPEEELQVAMVEPGTQPETVEVEEAPAGEVAAEADDSTAELPALDAAGALVSGAAGVVEIVKIPEDQDASEEPAEVSAADAEPEASAETDEILLAQQDTAPAEDEVPAITEDAADPAPAESEEDLQVAMAEPETQPETAEEMEEAPAVEVAAQTDDGTAEQPALESTEPMVSGVADDDGLVETVKIPEDQAPTADESLAESMDPAVPEPAEPDEAPAVEMAAEADDDTVELPALDSAEPMVSGVAGDDGVVEIVKIPEDQDAPEEPAEVTAADAEPATGSEEILLAQQDTAPAEEESMTVTVDPVVPALKESEEAEEAPAVEVAVQADEGTIEAPAGESAEPMVSGVAGDDEVVETVGIPEDEAAAPEEPAEVAETDAEPEAAAETDEILLAQQDTAPAEEETPAVTVDPAVPAQEEPEEESVEEPQVAVTVSGAQPEPADAPEAEPVSAVATDDGYGEPAPVATRDGLLDWIKNVFAILPDYGPKIAVGLLALLAALFVWQRRKARRMSDDGDPGSSDGESPPESGTQARSMDDAAGSDPARDQAPQGTADAGSADEGAEGAAASAEETSEGGPSGEIDPVVEADVYLEYDRIEQAIEVLKDAWSVDPERGELAEKLLEIYHMQDDRWAFDSLAEELRARGGLSRNVNWDRIFAMGKEVSPNNPLFTGEVPLHEEPAAGPEEAAGAPSPDPDDAGEEEPREESAREPDTDGEAPKPGDGGDGPVQAAAGESGAGEPPDEEPGGESPDSEETEETEDESETALELARAYMDLGEREIARGYLEEVLKGGNEDQKKRAQDFIRELDD